MLFRLYQCYTDRYIPRQEEKIDYIAFSVYIYFKWTTPNTVTRPVSISKTRDFH